MLLTSIFIVMANLIIVSIAFFGIFTVATAKLQDNPTDQGLSDDRCNHASLQEYLICHLLKMEITCCTAADDQVVLADFVNLIMAKCSDNLSKMQDCSREATLQLLENACECVEKDSVADSVSKFIRNTMQNQEENLHFISLPLDPDNLQEKKERISSPSDLNDLKQASYGCHDGRQEGVLCSAWKSVYMTAGNTMCREDSPCDYYGYSYYWCYTDHSNNWEYCCSGTCGYQGYNYRWCNSGNTWEYCGEYDTGKGFRTVADKLCLNIYPCGKHAAYSYYYWCYTDANKNWDYCCAPGEACTDNYCYTGDKSSGSEYCEL